MPKGWTARKPNYYLISFGESNTQFPIDGGVYPYHKQWGKNVKTGDLLLLYQVKGVWDIAVVTDVYVDGEKEIINYQFFQLDPAKTWDSQSDIEAFFPELKFHLHLLPNMIQPIYKSTFEKVLDGRKIKW